MSKLTVVDSRAFMRCSWRLTIKYWVAVFLVVGCSAQNFDYLTSGNGAAGDSSGSGGSAGTTGGTRQSQGGVAAHGTGGGVAQGGSAVAGTAGKGGNAQGGVTAAGGDGGSSQAGAVATGGVGLGGSAQGGIAATTGGAGGGASQGGKTQGGAVATGGVGAAGSAQGGTVATGGVGIAGGSAKGGTAATGGVGVGGNTNTTATGGAATGGVASTTGGTGAATGGAPTGGAATGGVASTTGGTRAATGGAPTGGTTAAGGTNSCPRYAGTGGSVITPPSNGFEANITGWVMLSGVANALSIVSSSTSACLGSAYLACDGTKRSGAWDGPTISVFSYLTSGHTYKVTLAARFDPQNAPSAAKPLTLSVGVTCTSTSVSAGYTHLQQTDTLKSWTRFTGTLPTTLTNCTSISDVFVYLETNSTEATYSINVDDFQLVDTN